MADWTEDLKAEVVKAYTDSDPTAESTTEIVKEIAEDIGKTANGVRMILSAANVYVAKTVSKSTEGNKSTKVSKVDAQNTLIEKIKSSGIEVTEEGNAVITKLTGKAAVYFTEVLKDIVG